MNVPPPARRILIAAAVAFTLSAALPAADVAAMCCPVPCPDCDLTSRGQLNLIVMDRAAGRVRMIPNLRFAGRAADFALVVPTPTEPELTPVDGLIWTQAALMTAPVAAAPRSFGSSGCGSVNDVPVPASGGFEDEVDVIRTQTVGAFTATLVRSTNPEALVHWLNGNGYGLDESEAAAIRPFAERGWVFTAMKLDTSKPEGQMPPWGWDANVDPVLFDFEAEDLEVPLSIIGINRAPDMPVVFYVLDDHRTHLPGFETTYANRISAAEYAAMEQRHPSLAEHLSPGRFFTRLDRTFAIEDAMEGSIRLVRAAGDEEFRRYGTQSGGFSLDLLLLLSGPLASRWIRRRRVG